MLLPPPDQSRGISLQLCTIPSCRIALSRLTSYCKWFATAERAHGSARSRLPRAEGRLAELPGSALPAGGEWLDRGAAGISVEAGCGLPRPRLSGGGGLHGPGQLGDLHRRRLEIRLCP